jgi:hypothetical protein
LFGSSDYNFLFLNKRLDRFDYYAEEIIRRLGKQQPIVVPQPDYKPIIDFLSNNTYNVQVLDMPELPSLNFTEDLLVEVSEKLSLIQNKTLDLSVIENGISRIGYESSRTAEFSSRSFRVLSNLFKTAKLFFSSCLDSFKFLFRLLGDLVGCVCFPPTPPPPTTPPTDSGYFTSTENEFEYNATTSEFNLSSISSDFEFNSTGHSTTGFWSTDDLSTDGGSTYNTTEDNYSTTTSSEFDEYDSN